MISHCTTINAHEISIKRNKTTIKSHETHDFPVNSHEDTMDLGTSCAGLRKATEGRFQGIAAAAHLVEKMWDADLLYTVSIYVYLFLKT